MRLLPFSPSPPSLALLPLLLCALLLSGCMTPSYRNGAQPQAQFDLGPVPLPPAEARPWRLRIAARGGLEDTAMRYRLAYADAARVMEYAQSRWMNPPAEILQRRLEARLFSAPGQARDYCQLQLELSRFEQVFDTASTSQGVLTVRAQLLHPRAGQVDERLFSAAAVAPSADAQGGVSALAQAADTLAARLISWREQGQELQRACLEPQP